jgi:hypothetical protein
MEQIALISAVLHDVTHSQDNHTQRDSLTGQSYTTLLTHSTVLHTVTQTRHSPTHSDSLTAQSYTP